MKYFVIIFIVVFYFSSAFASVCEESFSVDEIDRMDFLRRADEELKQALKEIRENPEEPVLKAQGYKPTYYRGLDQAREFNEVAKYLRKIKADSEKTHIPYFADQVEKIISDFEKGLRQHNKGKLKFLAEKLKLLEALKIEARKRVASQNVTYDWWATFNFWLSLIVEESDFIRKILEMRSKKKLIDNLDFNNTAVKEKVDTEIAYNKQLVQKIEEKINRIRKTPEEGLPIYVNISEVETKLEELNPEEIMSHEEVYTSEKLEELYSTVSRFVLRFLRSDIRPHNFDDIGYELGWYNIDNLKTYEAMQDLLQNIAVRARRPVTPYSESLWPDIPPWEIRSINSFIRTKENFPEEIMFFTTDELGIMPFNKLDNNSHFIGISGSPIKVHMDEMQGLKFSNHDVEHIGIAEGVPQKILERVGNISSRHDREKAELALFLFRHENVGFREIMHYKGVETNHSRSVLAGDKPLTTEADIEEMIQNMISDLAGSFGLDDYRVLLPDSVNVNNREEIEKFLMEATDIFTNMMLTHSSQNKKGLNQ